MKYYIIYLESSSGSAGMYIQACAAPAYRTQIIPYVHIVHSRDSWCPVQFASSHDVFITCPGICHHVTVVSFWHVIFRKIVNFQLRACEVGHGTDCPSQQTLLVNGRRRRRAPSGQNAPRPAMQLWPNPKYHRVESPGPPLEFRTSWPSDLLGH
jgi:hypothetical protein